jgi:hypothetical protein
MSGPFPLPNSFPFAMPDQQAGPFINNALQPPANQAQIEAMLQDDFFCDSIGHWIIADGSMIEM